MSSAIQSTGLDSSLLPIGTVMLNFYVNSGLEFAQLIGNLLVLYCYAISNKKSLWKVLLVMAVSGLCGQLIEISFRSNQVVNPESTSLAFLLGINEINWCTFESMTVLYSLLKVETIISNKTNKKILRGVMFALWIGFAACRANIGRLRVAANTTMNPAIAEAHSFSYMFWGLSDIVIVVLLVMNSVHHFRNEEGEVSTLVSTLFKSSIPRISVLVINTILIVIVGQFHANMTPVLINLNNFAWALKGSYPAILLVDILTTKNLLLAAKESSSSGANSIAIEESHDTYTHPSSSDLSTSPSGRKCDYPRRTEDQSGVYLPRSNSSAGGGQRYGSAQRLQQEEEKEHQPAYTGRSWMDSSVKVTYSNQEATRNTSKSSNYQ